jgi:hypothetical protein
LLLFGCAVCALAIQGTASERKKFACMQAVRGFHMGLI